ncbi:MAG TPA: Holliday junction branch migration protein RuvA [Dehalococcoidia bacterium]|nr:Holliday junction branch migration protein RuvA [Dehalococcoidia bacterium]
MIARLTGKVVDRAPDSLVIDVSGVGYLVYAPSSVVARAGIGEAVTLHTNLVVREDSMTLYGFLEAHEGRLFQTLTSVSGVGPKAALALLGIMNADELSFAIASGNATALARAPGVGQKLAARVVVELKDKMTSAAPATTPGIESEEVVAALMALGYSQAEAVDAVARSEFSDDAGIEEKVRQALSYFAKARMG